MEACKHGWWSCPCFERLDLFQGAVSPRPAGTHNRVLEQTQAMTNRQGNKVNKIKYETSEKDFRYSMVLHFDQNLEVRSQTDYRERRRVSLA